VTTDTTINLIFHKTSVREITQAAEVTKPTLYYYFKNKEELYAKLANICFEEILNSLNLASKTGDTTFERVINYFQAYTKLCSERLAVVRFVHLMAMVPERSAPDVGIIEFSRKVAVPLYEIIRMGIEKGEINKDSEIDLFYSLTGLIQLRVTSLLIGASTITDTTVVERAIQKAIAFSSSSEIIR
jgi:AcrR family transcriptional regulator